MALNLGSITIQNSRSVASLSKDALHLISEIKSLEMRFNCLVNEAANHNIEKRAENESDLLFLARIAKEANTKAHQLAAEEDAQRLDSVIEGAAKVQRRGLAGLLDRAADKVARL